MDLPSHGPADLRSAPTPAEDDATPGEDAWESASEEQNDSGPSEMVPNSECKGQHVPAALPPEQCRRHATRRPSPEVAPLCDKCSRVMLSYVAALQEFLDVVGEDIAARGQSSDCLWCVKDHLHDLIRSDLRHGSDRKPVADSEGKSTSGGAAGDVGTHQEAPLAGKRHGRPPRDFETNQRTPPVDKRPSRPPSEFETNQRAPPVDKQPSRPPSEFETNQRAPPVDKRPSRPPSDFENQGAPAAGKQYGASGSDFEARQGAPLSAETRQSPSDIETRQEAPPTGQRDGPTVNVSDSGPLTNGRLPPHPAGRAEPKTGPSTVAVDLSADQNTDSGHVLTTPPSWPDRKSASPVDGASVSPSWLECPPHAPVHPTFASLTDLGATPQEPTATSDELWHPWTTEPEMRQEAYVTIATDNMHALGCLALGNSLRLSGTTRVIAVLITDAVSPLLRHLLGSVFHLVQSVRSLDSLGTTKLSLLEQPELGVSFRKLDAWRLTSFSKCVFLEADTLVVQNCDELFDREELSAVPDIGWPDFFNCAVFVFTPSLATFWDLVDFAETRSCSDGGEQGLLNLYFRSWASDVSKRLPFIYNLMANVSYTYTPAFRKFGRDVKVVHFFDTYKPWHVQFHYSTGQMSPSANVHPTFAQFVHFWMDIFQKRVLPLFPEDVHRYCRKNCYVSAQELMTFFPPPPAAAIMESLPTPPSFRVLLPSVRTTVPDWAEQEARVLHTPETDAPQQGEQPYPEDAPQQGEEPYPEGGPHQEVEPLPTEAGGPQEQEEEGPSPEEEEVPVPEEAADYRKMTAWEQGRMDYLGRDSSDNIIRRLQGLIGGLQKTT